MDADRQRRLHVENRLQELNAKYGVLQAEPLPAWLDHYPTSAELAEAELLAPPAPPVPAVKPPAPAPAIRVDIP